ncbi:mitochondrial ornithine transporter 1 [Hyposmocoma kahamanoa]|uniref:mitochondrial ornithine transporter 1 n=1 Tax=Hyposmocoma kahamanoa TaxID=1477025 RepID=UPI000E6D92D0|nr:mitochondrial ornithine transporter 1 [Hyposmocoma kahamanoa]XP_026326694.1 mitochondrial ornithine transporter 1 [Hyposmocoma kahamanoa]XP_026326696.1 mitochondrial ornithine transporter 1 [Hyposmocoma kahamanoa]
MAHSSGSSESLKSGLIDFTAGSLGGVAVVYVGQPLDTVKVKMQTFPHLYKGMFDCLKQTLKKDGIIRGLYAGTTPAILANVAENSVLFAAYGYCQKFVCHVTGTQSVDQLSTLGNATAGFLAAFFSSFTLCPTELVKCQLQAMREVSVQGSQTAVTPVKLTPIKLTQQIFRQYGIQGLYRGLVPTIMREMPGYFFFFGGYEGTRVLLAEPGQSKDDIGFVKTMIAGAVGGLVLWTIIFPSDVIKSRMQISNKSQKFMTVAADIVRKEGALALYNGLLPTLVRTIPATAALFVVYEYSKKFMHQSFGD